MSDLLARIKQLEDDLSWRGGYNVGRSASTDHIAALKIANQRLEERTALLETTLESMCDIFHRIAWRPNEREAIEKARAALSKS